MAVLSIGQVWGADVLVYTLEPVAGSNNSYAGNCDVEIEDADNELTLTWNVEGNSQTIPWRLGGKASSTSTTATLNVTRKVYSQDAISDNINKVIVTQGTSSVNSISEVTLIVSTAANGGGTVISSVTEDFVASNDITFERPTGHDWTNRYYTFVYEMTLKGKSNTFIQFSKAEFYKEQSGSSKPTVSSEHLAWGANSAKVFINGELYDGHVAHNALPSLTYDLSATLTYESTNTDVATISSTGAVTIKAVGSTTIKATYPEDATYAATTVSYTLTVDKIWTVEGAQAAISALDNNGTIANQYVAGTISQVGSFNSTYSSITYYISDDGTTTGQLEVYSGKGLNGANFSKASDLSVGADVLIKGELKKYKSGSNPAKNEINQNSQQVIYKPLAPLSWSEASYEADMSGSNTFPTLSKPDGVTVTYSSTNTDAATINPSTGAISLVAVGSTTIKATFTGNETYKANEVSYTLTVSNSVLRADISFEENGGSDVADLTDQSNLPDPLPTITKAGYNFGGWWTTSTFEAGTEAVAGDAVTSTDPITLYAKWLNPYTVTEALEMIAALDDNGEIADVYVSGIVCTAPSNLISGGYLTYYISVDGTETNRLQVYKGKNVGNIAFTDKEDVQAADQLVVYGPLMKYVSGTTTKPEFNTGNYLYSLSRKAEAGIEWGVASFDAYIGESNTFPTLTNPNSLTVVYSSSNETAATIDPATGAITLGTTPNVNTTITASFAGNSSYKAAEVSYTLNVYNPTNPGTITYEENGGSEVTDVTEAVSYFPNPLPTTTRTNYIFGGWYIDAGFNTEAVAGAPMNGNVTLYAKWAEIPVWAYTYTSNVTLSTTGGTSASAAKVKFYGEEGDGYDAIKAGTSSYSGAVKVTVPAQATKLHFHAYGWSSESIGLTVTAPTGVTVSPSTEISINSNAGLTGNTPFTLAEGSDPKTDAYYVVALSGNAEETTLTFTATSGKRFVLFGVNQEGGLVPELDHITITGELANMDYELGDELDKTGLTVTAYYTLAGAAHHDEDVTNDVVWSNDPLTGGQTSVDVTATYGGKSDTKACAINAVVVPTPEIILSESALEFSGKQYGAVANKTFNVTLKNVAAATVALSGDDAAKFSIDPVALTANGTVTVSVANTNVAGSFSATITVSDDAHAATSQTVDLTLTITADEAPASTTAEWIEATEIYDGMPVLITGVNTTTSKIYAMGAQNDNNRAAVEATLNGDVLIPGNGTKAFTLVKQDDDTYAIMTSDGKYLYAASSSKNYLRTQTDVDADAKWTITVTSASAEGSSNRHVMQFNTSSGLFSCYADASQAPIKLYTPKTYTRTVSGNYGTICLPNGGVLTNGALYEIAEMDYLNDKPNKIYFDEVEGGVMVAGKPYIFKPNDGETTLRVVYTDAANADEGNYNGLYGKYNKTPLAKDNGNYILKNNQYYYVNSENVYCDANRAYIKLAEVPAFDPGKPSYGRRRISLNVNNEQVATGFESIEASEKPMKLMIDGQIYILRGQKMYDATGRLVK